VELTMNSLLNDPALWIGVIRTGMILLVSFGVAITEPQQAAVLAFAGAVMAILSLALSGVTRKLTTPTAAPVLPQGTTVEVVTPAGRDNQSVTL
jgi:hypothetical protein